MAAVGLEQIDVPVKSSCLASKRAWTSASRKLGTSTQTNMHVLYLDSLYNTQWMVLTCSQGWGIAFTRSPAVVDTPPSLLAFDFILYSTREWLLFIFNLQSRHKAVAWCYHWRWDLNFLSKCMFNNICRSYPKGFIISFSEYYLHWSPDQWNNTRPSPSCSPQVFCWTHRGGFGHLTIQPTAGSTGLGLWHRLGWWLWRKYFC